MRHFYELRVFGAVLRGAICNGSWQKHGVVLRLELAYDKVKVEGVFRSLEIVKK